jgi:hypothetical protein
MQNGRRKVNDIDFGTTMTVVGMGGTLLSLWVLTLFISALKKLFPVKQDQGAGQEGGN